MQSNTVTWEQLEAMERFLKENKAPEPYYIKVEKGSVIYEVWQRKQKYMERYKRRGERMRQGK